VEEVELAGEVETEVELELSGLEFDRTLFLSEEDLECE